PAAGDRQEAGRSAGHDRGAEGARFRRAPAIHELPRLARQMPGRRPEQHLAEQKDGAAEGEEKCGGKKGGGGAEARPPRSCTRKGGRRPPFLPQKRAAPWCILRRRSIRSAVGGCVVNILAKLICRPVSGFTM